MAVALLDPLSRLDPPHRPDWRSELTTAQFGPMAEDLLAVCIEAAGSGSATIARPIVDRGIDLYRLPEWLASAPGWATPVPPVPHPPRPHDVSEGDGLTQWRGDIGRLWTATELERAGAASIVLAQDRVRLDTVTLLIHDLSSRHIAGLHIRTGKITPGRTVHFEVPRPPFFIDQRLYVLLVLLQRDDRVHDFCLLIPSDALPGLGYSETITLDPLTKRFVQYRVPSDEVGSVFLKSVFGG